MKKGLLLFAFMFSGMFMFPQSDIQWLRHFENQKSKIPSLTEGENSQIYALEQFSEGYHVLSIDSKGNIDKSVQISGGYHLDIPGIKSDQSGDVLIFGTFKKHLKIASYVKNSTTHYNKSFIARLNFDEPFDSTNLIIFDKINATRMEILPGDHILLGGHFRHSAEVLGKELSGKLDDVFLMRLSPGFELQWIKSFGGTSDDRFSALHITEKGNILAGANFSHEITIDENTIKPEKGNINGSVLWQMDASGKLIWNHLFSGHKFGKIQMTGLSSNTEKIYIALSFNKECLLNDELVSSMGRTDILISSLNSSGKNPSKVVHLKSPYDLKFTGLVSRNNEILISGSFHKRIHLQKSLYYANGDTTGYSFKPDIFLLNYNVQSKSTDFLTFGTENIEQSHALCAGSKNVYLSGSFDKSFQLGGYSLKNSDYTSDGFLVAFGHMQSPGGKKKKPPADAQKQGKLTKQEEPDEQVTPADSVVVAKKQPEPEDDNTSGPDNTASKPSEEDSNCPSPDKPVVSNTEAGNYDFSIYWNAISLAKYYEVYVSENQSFTDTVISYPAIKATSEPGKKVEGLVGDKTYYFNIVVVNECNKKATSETYQIKTLCEYDTILFSEGPDLVHFQVVDCRGKIECMGLYKSDSVMMIGECSGGPGAKIYFPKRDSASVGPVEPNSTKCNNNEYALPKRKYINNQWVTDTICIPNSGNKLTGKAHPCYDLPTDRERIICLAREGMEIVEARLKKMDDYKTELQNMTYENTTSPSDSIKLKNRAKWLFKRFNALKDTLEIIREEYQGRLNAIVSKRTIKVDVNNKGAGFTITPQATAYEVRWNKYDDRFKNPGPQLMVEFEISNFPKKVVDGWGFTKKIRTVRSVQLDILDGSGKMLSPTSTLLLTPCFQVRGTLTTNLAILKQYENVRSLAFGGSHYKAFNPELWNDCDPDFLHPERERNKIVHNYLQNDVQSPAVNKMIQHLLISVVIDDYPDLALAEIDFYFRGCSQMATIYFEIYHDQSTTLNFLHKLREKVTNGYSTYYYYNGYKVYPGFKDFDKETGAKIKAALTY